MVAQWASARESGPDPLGRSQFALFRADLAMAILVQWPFQAPRAGPNPGSAHLSCRAIWMLQVRRRHGRYGSDLDSRSMQPNGLLPEVKQT